MPQPIDAASQSNILPLDAVFKRQDDTSKSSVIGIVASATLLVVAAICGLVFWYIWRRKNRQNRDRNGYADPADGRFNTLRDRSSKTPLMRLENHSQAPADQGTPVPWYQEDNQASIVTPSIPGRTMSASTIRSLPPSYAVAICASPGPQSEAGNEHNTAIHYLHRSSSSASRPDRTRPITSMNSPQSSDDNHEQHRERSRSRAPLAEDSNDNTLSVAPQRPVTRPRALSRFHEDLDIRPLS